MLLVENPFELPWPGRSMIKGLLYSDSGNRMALTNRWSIPAPAIKRIDFFALSIDSKLSKGQEVAVFTAKNEVVGVVKMNYSANELTNMESGEIGKPAMILMEHERYPPQWPKQE